MPPKRAYCAACNDFHSQRITDEHMAECKSLHLNANPRENHVNCDDLKTDHAQDSSSAPTSTRKTTADVPEKWKAPIKVYLLKLNCLYV